MPAADRPRRRSTLRSPPGPAHRHGQQAERRRQHAMLERRVRRTAERTPEGEVTVQHPRRARALGLPADEADPDR